MARSAQKMASRSSRKMKRSSRIPSSPRISRKRFWRYLSRDAFVPTLNVFGRRRPISHKMAKADTKNKKTEAT